MKNKIILFLFGCLLIVASCSEDFITKDFDKSRYNPATFYNSKERALIGLNACYSNLSNQTLWANVATIMPNVLTDELYGTGYVAGYGNWGSITDVRPPATAGEVANLWNGCNQGILACNVALEKIPTVSAIDATFTAAMKDSYLGQIYFLRALYYYELFTYFPQDRIVLRRTVPKVTADYIMEPVVADSIFNFIEKSLKVAQTLLTASVNTTAGYEKGRATRGTATALLGKLYMKRRMYQLAADQFKLLLPGVGVGNAAYGTYSLQADYRNNFINTTENNSESLFEIQFANVNGSGAQGNDGASVNETAYYTQNWTLNRTSWSTMWWNWAVANFSLNGYNGNEINGFEKWTEGATTVYDYRVYETFWGVPNGANFTENGVLKTWITQGWSVETVVGLTGVYSIRKNAYDNTNQVPAGTSQTHSDVNWRLIRLSDIMLLYAECMANINPANVTPSDVNSAIYWIDQVRTRANKVMADQSHLYSSRVGVPGQLPDATTLKAAKGWTLLQLIQHERYVELYCEGTRYEDLIRWQVGAGFIPLKSGFTGYQTLTLPVPSTETDNNPLNRGK